MVTHSLATARGLKILVAGGLRLLPILQYLSSNLPHDVESGRQVRTRSGPLARISLKHLRRYLRPYRKFKNSNFKNFCLWDPGKLRGDCLRNLNVGVRQNRTTPSALLQIILIGYKDGGVELAIGSDINCRRLCPSDLAG